MQPVPKNGFTTKQETELSGLSAQTGWGYAWADGMLIVWDPNGIEARIWTSSAKSRSILGSGPLTISNPAKLNRTILNWFSQAVFHRSI